MSPPIDFIFLSRFHEHTAIGEANVIPGLFRYFPPSEKLPVLPPEQLTPSQPAYNKQPITFDSSNRYLPPGVASDSSECWQLGAK